MDKITKKEMKYIICCVEDDDDYGTNLVLDEYDTNNMSDKEFIELVKKYDEHHLNLIDKLKQYLKWMN